MKMVIMGPQGSGKGTFAKKLAKHMAIPHISTGDALREAAKTDKKVDEMLQTGELFPDDMMLNIIKQRIRKEDAQNGFILDGYPRNMEQTEKLNEIVDLDRVIHMNVHDDECVRRLGNRQTCRQCSTIFGGENPPKEEGKCDNCQGELYVRDDDKEETIRKRLDIFHEKTKPILSHYKEKGKLVEVKVEGIRHPDDVFVDLKNAMGLN